MSDSERRVIKEEKVTYYEEVVNDVRRIRKETTTFTFFPDGTTHHNPTITTSVEYL